MGDVWDIACDFDRKVVRHFFSRHFTGNFESGIFYPDDEDNLSNWIRVRLGLGHLGVDRSDSRHFIYTTQRELLANKKGKLSRVHQVVDIYRYMVLTKRSIRPNYYNFLILYYDEVSNKTLGVPPELYDIMKRDLYIEEINCSGYKII